MTKLGYSQHKGKNKDKSPDKTNETKKITYFSQRSNCPFDTKNINILELI